MKRHSALGVAAAVLLAACRTDNGSPSGTSTAHRGTAAVNGGTLHYEVAGAGPPIVLIHGGFGDSRMWDDLFAPLSKSFRVIRYDHRGFGQSPASPTPYSPVDDLRRLLDHLEVRTVHLVGNSMGGALAIDFALLHPDRTGNVVAIASPASGYPVPDAAVKDVSDVFAVATERGTEAAAALWLRHPMVAVASSDPRAAPRLREMVRDNQRIFLMEHWPSEQMTPSAYDRLHAVRARVLLLVGEQDTQVVVDGVKATAARIAGARMVSIPATDHLPQMEAPEQVNDLIASFLAR